MIKKFDVQKCKFKSLMPKKSRVKECKLKFQPQTEFLSLKNVHLKVGDKKRKLGPFPICQLLI